VVRKFYKFKEIDMGMKGVFVIIDGLADLPCKQLRGKTPLEAAETPNLDYLASKGKLGWMFSIKENFIPGTSDAVVSFFGRNWQNYPRGWLEALGVGIDLKNGDLALRANFATIDNLKKRNIIDRRAGRTLTTKEAKLLESDLNKNIRVPAKFIFKSTLQHRAVLVFRGGFSDNITDTDPEYSTNKQFKRKLRFSVPEDDDDISQYSANIVNNFIEQSFNILDKHPINEKRRKKGFYPANIIITRSPGTSVEKIKRFRRWACSTSVPVMKGICKSLGINLFEFGAVEFKHYDIYSNLRKNLVLEMKKSIKLMKKRRKEFDYFLVYLKEIDAAGHDNKPLEKKEMIEMIDKRLFRYLRKLEGEKVKVLVTADHATPCKLKLHSADPVPVLLCDWIGERGGKERRFTEKGAKKGKLGKIYGKDILGLF
jgi:2,3-bisphosphoglycerate-independent phosphoglycerate mutase